MESGGEAAVDRNFVGIGTATTTSSSGSQVRAVN